MDHRLFQSGLKNQVLCISDFRKKKKKKKAPKLYKVKRGLKNPFPTNSGTAYPPPRMNQKGFCFQASKKKKKKKKAPNAVEILEGIESPFSQHLSHWLPAISIESITMVCIQ